MQVTDEHQKRYPTPLIIREIGIKGTMSHLLQLTRMATVKTNKARRNQEITGWQGCGVTGISVLVGM